jgi:hypothetical protein
MKKILFFFGLLLLFAVNFQQSGAAVDQDVGVEYTIDQSIIATQIYLSPACQTPEVVYLGDSFVYPVEALNYTSLGWLDQNSINIILLSDGEMYFRDVGSYKCNYTYYNLLNLNGTLTNNNDRRADLTRLDIGEINNSKIFTV